MDYSLLLIFYCLGITLTITLIGFKRVIWFISIGYTLSITVLCVAMMFYCASSFNLYNWLQIGLLGAWGLRLGLFLIKREFNSEYNKNVKEQIDASQNQSLLIKFMIWIGVSVLYVMMFSPGIFALQDVSILKTIQLWIAYAGVVLLLSGLVIESIADYQKSRFKKNSASNYCDRGLYCWVRCPNYFGEILVWTGHLIVAIPFLNTWWQTVIAVLGWICITLIMMGSTKRLEKTHKEKYGHDPNFKSYINTVPVLFPWLPIYSLEKVKVYLE